MSEGIDLKYSYSITPGTSQDWVNMDKNNRIQLLKESINFFAPEVDISVIDANENGQVSIIINSSIKVNDRGAFLLNLEENLKNTIDVGINIWHEAIGDKSSLRNLRGIEVLS